jgi:hypothetical protein
VEASVIKVIDFKPFAPHRCGFESWQGLWNIAFEEAIQLAYGTSVVLPRCPFLPWNNAWKGTWGMLLPVKLERRNMTFTVSVRRKIQSIKQTNFQCLLILMLCHVQKTSTVWASSKIILLLKSLFIDTI